MGGLHKTRGLVVIQITGKTLIVGVKSALSVSVLVSLRANATRKETSRIKAISRIMAHALVIFVTRLSIL